MEASDIVKTLVCPIWGIASWNSKRIEKQTDAQIYGDAPQAPGTISATAASLGIFLFVLLFVVLPVLAVCGIIKAFMCGPNPTNLGGSGFIWGILGIFVPGPVAIFYLFAGHCKSAIPDGYSKEAFPSE